MNSIKPIRLFLASIFIWLIIYMQMPVEYLYSGSVFFPVVTLFLFSVFFVFGILSLKSSSIKPKKELPVYRLKQIINTLFIIGLIGVLIKVYVGVFKTGVLIAKDSFEFRLENMDKELTGGFIGILASILFPFSFVTLLMVTYNYKKFNTLFLIIVFIIGSYPFVETFFLGGRTIIALLGTTLMFTIFASYLKNSKAPILKIKLLGLVIANLPKFILKKRVLIPSFLIILLFVSYSIDVIDKRLIRFEYGDATLKVWEHKDYQWVKFNSDFKKKYYNTGKQERARMIGLYSLEHYFAHGVIEYVRLVNHLEKTTGYYYGQYQFNVFFKFFRAFGIPLKSAKQMQSVIERKAVYQTFWGPFYLDFGIFGIFIVFFWGRFVKRVYIHSKNENTQYVVFYAYMATLIITSAFINFLVGSSSYYLFAFLMSLLLFKYWPSKQYKLNK